MGDMDNIKNGDIACLEEIKAISRRGNSAEVRLKSDGEWHVLEVKKKKKEIKVS